MQGALRRRGRHSHRDGVTREARQHVHTLTSPLPEEPAGSHADHGDERRIELGTAAERRPARVPPEVARELRALLCRILVTDIREHPTLSDECD
jgi:hypothetical protein